RPGDAPLRECLEYRKSPIAHEPVHQRGDEHGLARPRQAGDAEPHSRIDQALAVFHHGTQREAGMLDDIGEGKGHGVWDVESGAKRGKVLRQATTYDCRCGAVARMERSEIRDERFSILRGWSRITRS